MMSKHLRALALLTALLFAASGCAGQSADAPGEVPFTAGAYPVDAAAECERDEAGQLKPGLARIDAPDENTVVFELCAPDPSFLQKLTAAPNGIQDSGYLVSASTSGDILSKPNGTGPLQVTSSDDYSVVYQRFENYWGNPSASQRVIVQWQPDPAARLVQLEAGSVDGIDNASKDDLARLLGNPSFTVTPRQPIATMYLSLNTDVAPLNNIDVRKAIALAIDRQQIVDLFFPNGSVPASHFVPCAVEFGCSGPSSNQFSRETARALLASSGLSEGLELTLYYRDVQRVHTPDPAGIATDIQSQLAEIGIDLTIEGVEPATFIAEMNAGNLKGLVLTGWTPDYLDVMNFLLPPLVNDPARFGSNYSPFDGSIRSVGVEPKPRAREMLMEEVNEAILDTSILVPIAHGSSGLIWTSTVNGAHASPIAFEDFAKLSVTGRDQVVFLTTVAPISLYCSDETDANTFRFCNVVNERLYQIESSGTIPVPRLATNCAESKDSLKWTCTLREGVRFHNGASLDAGDVRDSFAAQWDCAHPAHVGRTGDFRYWAFMSGFLNPNACVDPQ